MDPFIFHITYLAAITFVVGGIGTFALYHFRFREFLKSGLVLKILVWIPLWFIYIAAAYYWFSAFIFLIIVMFLVEIFWKNRNRAVVPRMLYATLFVTGIGLFAAFVEQTSNPPAIALSLLAACALSDITAFFAGRLCGYHALPQAINPRKSWEGVLGQFVGGAIGVERIKALGALVIPLGVALCVGLGSACGDIGNSFFKRTSNVVRWSNVIPGHGGIGDRFASIAGTGFFLFFYKIFFH
jgi:phosphatidate cytidylyltransferase